MIKQIILNEFRLRPKLSLHFVEQKGNKSQLIAGNKKVIEKYKITNQYPFRGTGFVSSRPNLPASKEEKNHYECFFPMGVK